MVAAVAHASSGGRAGWCRALAPLGQRSLTLYIGHGLLCIALYAGIGLALQPATWLAATLAALLWLLALGLAQRWPQVQGPLERWMARP
ncbi:DUF418 domain-containing protein [Piscinibacter sakaiensis]|uniref:DUF418 domain-containing protein n=1 Tax=Piscinibacter sakaiensis TaxID=1547922 RepID=UPI00372914C7